MRIWLKCLFEKTNKYKYLLAKKLEEKQNEPKGEKDSMTANILNTTLKCVLGERIDGETKGTKEKWHIRKVRKNVFLNEWLG